MSTITIASSPADARAAEHVEQHHAQMAGRLNMLTAALVAAVDSGDVAAAREDLLAWLRTELVPHATAEERTLYPAAAALPETRLLVEAMLAEHALLHRLVADLEAAASPLTTAAVATALESVFASHLAKENGQLFPALVASSRYSVAEMLDGMHELLGEHDGARTTAVAPEEGHQCGCGGHDEAGMPELDTRTIPHAIRHATIFGALDGLRSGSSLLLTANHDPVPLLAQLQQRAPGAFEVSYVERGPELWRLQFTRRD